MIEPGRNATLSNVEAYRYGFNGKENDNDIENGMQDYGMRIYDGRLGRFLSVDPLTKNYPWNSTYAFAENSPIKYIDLDGREKGEPSEPGEGTGAAAQAEQQAAEDEGYDNPDDYLKASRGAEERIKEEQRQKNDAEDEAHAEKDPIWRRWRDNLQRYARGAIEVAPDVLGGTPTEVFPRITMNKLNGNNWEKAVGEALERNPNYQKVARQVSLKVTGTMKDGQVFTAKVRIDFAGIYDEGLSIDLYEAKYSIDEITVNNVKQSLTEQQRKMDRVFQTAESITFQVRGNSLKGSDIPSGTDITARIKKITIVVPEQPNQSPKPEEAPKKTNTGPN